MKLSLENDDYKSKELLNQQLVSNNAVMNNKNGAGYIKIMSGEITN